MTNSRLNLPSLKEELPLTGLGQDQTFPYIVSLCLPNFEMQAASLLIIKGKSSKMQGHVPKVTLLLCEA